MITNLQSPNENNLILCFVQAYQRLQIQQQMLQAQRNVSGPIRQQEQQVGLPSKHKFECYKRRWFFYNAFNTSTGL